MASTRLETEGIELILLEARGPTERGADDKELWDSNAHCCPACQNPSQPQTLPPLGTFLAPSFIAFFLASSKSSFWPMLA